MIAKDGFVCNWLLALWELLNLHEPLERSDDALLERWVLICIKCAQECVFNEFACKSQVLGFDIQPLHVYT